MKTVLVIACLVLLSVCYGAKIEENPTPTEGKLVSVVTVEEDLRASLAAAVEEELRLRITECCTSACSPASFRELHNRLDDYMRKENHDAELVEFGRNVLAGKRCGGHKSRKLTGQKRTQGTRSSNVATFDCPAYVTYPNPFNCTFEIYAPAGIIYVGQYADGANAACNYNCYFSLTENSTYFYTTAHYEFYPGSGNFNLVPITAYFYYNSWATYEMFTRNITVYGAPVTTSGDGTTTTTGGYSTTSPASSTTSRSTTSSPSSTTGHYNVSTSSSTTGGSNGTSTTTTGGSGVYGLVYINCPTVVYTSNFTCNIYVETNDGIYFTDVTYNSSLSCSNCYSFLYSSSSYYSYTIYLNGYSTGAHTLTAYFLTLGSMQYFFSAPVVVYYYPPAPEVNLLSATGPSVLATSASYFNVALNIYSTLPLYEIVVYYGNANSSLSTGYTYYPYSPSNPYYNVTLTMYTNTPVNPGRYCADVYIRDSTYYNTVVFYNATCVNVISGGNCAPGYYISFNQNTGTYRCIACPAGFYSYEPNSLSCTACPAGYASSCASASTSCTQCPSGTSSQQGRCEPCAAGTYNPYGGQSQCFPCSPGQYASETGSTYCYSCNSGTYSCANAVTCTACAAGSFSFSNSASCTPCAEGYYAPSTGSYYCYECPSNTYSVSGAANCTQCPYGSTSPPGSFTCLELRK